ncbi:TonB-dependent receptor [Candidatus Viadribacter manganicus]|uniref:TonB-dependent receptor n=1 Tax=Candidatus Viadribacter manganicus TaxID=1759059 RepID=A0A1B1AJ05_9PROT|nr:TonB-dependent receptor [Candidatus Viadribacter manganicus]ANP46537.1 TonB-dependent receptor [Candidatus Viadribacter manganicus]
MKRFGDTARVALLLASVAASPFALSTPAFAQDGVSEEEELVVTARRRDETLQDVPIAITVQSAEQLDQRGASDITVLQQTSPNSTVQVARGSNSTLIAFIRGVGQQDPLWGFEPGVGLYVDDVYVARPQAAVLDIFDIQRIEVLRGPQGTLYGRNSVGGAVRYVTSPLDTEEAHLRARFNYGSYNQMEAIISGSVPLTENFVVGGALALYARDGYGENLVTGAEHYNKDVDAFRLSAEWNPTDALSIRLSADRVVDDSNPRHGHRLASYPAGGTSYDVLPNVYDTRAGAGDDNHVTTAGQALRIDYELTPNLMLRSITATRRGKTEGIIDFDNTEFPTLDIPAYYRDEQFTQEFQLVFDYDRIQGVAGLFYLDATAEGAFDTVLGGLATTIFTQGSVDTESLAAFADVSFDITDSLALSVGARWTRDEKTGQVYRQNFTGIRSPFFGNGAAVPGLVRTNYTNDASFEEVTPRVSLTWEASDALTLYGSYSQGFKSGGFDMRGDAVFTPDTVNGYAPEFVDTYEIGFHSSFMQGRLNLSGAVFSSEYTDMQITRQEPTTLGGIASFVDNAASADINGAEIEGSYRITDSFRTNFSVGYIDGQFNEYMSNTVVANPAPPPATIVVPIDLSGSAALQNTPDLTASLSFTYEAPLANGTLAITPSAAYRGDSQMFEFATPALDQGAYTLYNASITWTSDSDHVRLGLHALNLSDEEYRVGGYNFPGATFGNSIIGYYGPPQTITGSIEFRF